MALSESTTNKIKVLLYEGKQSEAEDVLIEETGLSEEAARDYVNRLASSLKDSKQPRANTQNKFLPYIFFMISMVAWIAAVLIYINKQNKIENSFITSAQVVKFVISEGNGFAPVLKYEIEGVEYEYTSNVFSNPPAYEPNEIIEIYVSKDNPQDVIINSFVSKWMVIIIIAFFGLVFDVLGVVALKMKNRQSSDIDFFDREDSLGNELDD